MSDKRVNGAAAAGDKQVNERRMRREHEPDVLLQQQHSLSHSHTRRGSESLANAATNGRYLRMHRVVQVPCSVTFGPQVSPQVQELVRVF